MTGKICWLEHRQTPERGSKDHESAARPIAPVCVFNTVRWERASWTSPPFCHAGLSYGRTPNCTPAQDWPRTKFAATQSESLRLPSHQSAKLRTADLTDKSGDQRDETKADKKPCQRLVTGSVVRSLVLRIFSVCHSIPPSHLDPESFPTLPDTQHDSIWAIPTPHPLFKR